MSACTPVPDGAAFNPVTETDVPVESRALRTVPVTTSSPEALKVFLKARDLSAHNRNREATDGFKRAIVLDPNFALAHCYLGYKREGSSGLKELKLAVELSRGLPEAEQLFIRLYLAQREGDQAAITDLLRRLFKLAPDDFRVSFEYGQRAFERRDWEGAVLAFIRSVNANPNCNAYNELGYALGMQERYDLAISAFKRCIELAPKEPNAVDSLGEIYLAAGRLPEADAAFAQALALDPGFWSAWAGRATVSSVRRDWESALGFLAQARSIPGLGFADRMELDVMAAWALLSAGRDGEALAKVASMERESKQLSGDAEYSFAQAALVRSALLTHLGRFPEAVAAANVALSRAGSRGLPGAITEALRIRAFLRRSWAEAKLGNVAQAKTTLALMQSEVGKNPSSGEGSSSLHLAKGGVLWALGDLHGARREFAQCELLGVSPYTEDYRVKPEDSFCQWQLMQLEELLGEKVAAERTRRALLRHIGRDPVYLYVRTQLSTDGSTLN